MPRFIKRWNYDTPLWQKMLPLYVIIIIGMGVYLYVEPVELQAVKINEKIISEQASYVEVVSVSIDYPSELHTIKYINGYIFWFIPIERSVLVVTDIDVKPHDFILLNRVDVITTCEYYDQNGKVTNEKFIKVEYKTDFYGYCGESYYYEILEKP